MADQDLTHTAEIIKAALPFIDIKSRVTAELFIKIFDLLGSLKSMTASSNMAACGYEKTEINVEGLLAGIRPLCNNKEKDFIDRILNIFNAKRMFEMYNNFMSTMKTMQEFGDFSFSNSEGGSDADTMAGNFKGFNFDSIFGNSTNNSEAKTDSTAEAKTDPTSEAKTENASETFNNLGGEGTSQANTSESGTANIFGNNRMLDMLKAMVPPEQMSTFENLSMLLNTMTYDNNSKSDESKECNNV